MNIDLTQVRAAINSVGDALKIVSTHLDDVETKIAADGTDTVVDTATGGVGGDPLVGTLTTPSALTQAQSDALVNAGVPFAGFPLTSTQMSMLATAGVPFTAPPVNATPTDFATHLGDSPPPARVLPDGRPNPDYVDEELVLLGTTTSIGPRANATLNVGNGYSLPVESTVDATATPGRFTLTSDTLPSGLTLNPSSGEISGTPTTPGTWSSLVVTVTDAKGVTASTSPFTITVV